MQTRLSIASKINELYTQAELFSKQAKDTASQAISFAVECGKLLNNQKKAVGHGAWLGWLKENCPNISERTAQKYMRLSRKVCELEDSSKTNADSDLPTVSSENVSKLFDGSPKTLTQAYIAAGVIPEPKKPETNASVFEATITFTRHIDALVLWYKKRTEYDPIENWQPNIRGLLINELRPWVKIYNELLDLQNGTGK